MVALNGRIPKVRNDLRRSMGWVETPRELGELSYLSEEANDQGPPTTEDLDDIQDGLASLADPGERITVEELARELGL
jgi:hypothetical protein